MATIIRPKSFSWSSFSDGFYLWISNNLIVPGMFFPMNGSFQENIKNSPMMRCSVSPVTAALDLRGVEIPAELFPVGKHLINLVNVWGKYILKKKEILIRNMLLKRTVNTQSLKLFFYSSNYNYSLVMISHGWKEVKNKYIVICKSELFFYCTVLSREG